MLEQALVALAAAGGAAVVQAAGTDAWRGLRSALARWFGRGDEQREQDALEHLDGTEAELQSAEEGTRRDQAVMWQTRITARLEDLRGDERASAAQELDALLRGRAPQGGETAGQGGVAVSGGQVSVSSTQNSIAAFTINGGASVSHPPEPDPSRG
ncbi:hypothetical protein ACIQU4_18025 [Streptomyces sp. NPDC090741]|uniref:hypothetical protein n=1 Tax=Streptomyces sp. NPDC090741 TaxID=3365967 RepID=UPI0037F53E28